MFTVTIRPIEVTDLPIMLAWGQNSEIWKYMPTSRRGEKLTWEKHHEWFVKRTSRADFMIIAKGTHDAWARAVGVVHVTNSQHPAPEVGLYIGETTLWGQGIGKRALSLVLDILFISHSAQKVYAVIHPRNKRSVKLFTSAGFKKVGKARHGQGLYLFEIPAPEVVCLKTSPYPSLTLQPSTGA